MGGLSGTAIRDIKMKQKLRALIGTVPSEEGEFRRRMRLHQGWWRAFVLGEAEGRHPNDPQQSVCNTISDGKLTRKNFLSGVTARVVEQTLCQRCQSDSGMIQEKRLYNNLLSSQPLCFNFFAELKQDTALARDVLNQSGFKMSAVTSVLFEYAPAANYTKDNSAFDVAIEIQQAGQKGLIGLECKYTDSFSAKEYDRPEYRQIFEQSKVFTGTYETYISKEYNQLFRNQLIAEALMQNGEFDFVITGLFCHGDDAAVKTGLRFQEMLNGKAGVFRVITYQDFLGAMQRLDLSWKKREYSMLLWARYCGTVLSDVVAR